MDIHREKQESFSLTQIVFEKIRDNILNNVYKSGSKLIESFLAEELAVSRTPVREALKQLTIDGFVHEIPNKCVVVNEITVQDMIDIFNLRTEIEAVAIRWAVERISEAELNKLDEIYSLMEFYCLKGNTDKVLELDTKFHEMIYNSINNRFFERTLKHFHMLLKTARKSMIKKEGRINETIYEHRLILEAFVNRDVEKAIQHSVDHSKAIEEIVFSEFKRKSINN